MSDLSVLYRVIGNYIEAEPLCINALQLRRETLGEKHPDTLESINSLAMLYQAQGRYSEAEPLFKQALQLKKKVLGKEHPDTMTSINNLAMLYQAQRRYNEAKPLLKQVLLFRKRILGGNHPDTLQSMDNLAISYYKQGNYHEAEPLYKEAIKLNKEILGGEHLMTLRSQGNLAALYNAEGRYGEAEQLDKEVLLLKEKSLGKEHPETLISMNNLALLYLIQGRYSEAEPLYKKLLPVIENKMGANHPNIIDFLGNYIILLVNTNRPAMALRLLKEVERRLLSRSFQELYDSSSEKTRRSYLCSINYFQQVVFSLANQHPREEYQRYAAEVMLRWKQVYAEESGVQHKLLNLSNDPDAAELSKQLAASQAKVSQALRQAKEKENIPDLIEKANQDETALLALARHLRTGLEVKKVTLDKVLAALPQGSSLIEYRIFQPVDFKTGKGGERHLAALLLLADPKAKQRVVFRDLGPFAKIGKLTNDLEEIRRKISEITKQFQANQQTKTVAAILQEQLKILEKEAEEKNTEACRPLLLPFDDQIKNLKQLYIAPDGPLNLLSFASLRLPDGRFLAERQQINNLQTGRDLLQADKSTSSGKGIVIIGGVEYGPKPAGKTEASSRLVAYQQRAAQMLRDGIDYLPESKVEAQTVGTIFFNNTGKQPAVLIGDDASEYSLKHLKQPPRILHLSTHGFIFPKTRKAGWRKRLRCCFPAWPLPEPTTACKAAWTSTATTACSTASKCSASTCMAQSWSRSPPVKPAKACWITPKACTA